MKTGTLARLLPILLLASAVPTAAQDASRFAAIDHAIEASISRGDIPGAVLVIGHQGKIVYRHAYGMRSLEPQREAMTLDTVFDVASLTKVVATAPSAMRLLQLGKIRLNDPVARYLPEFAAAGKQNVTIRLLMTHFSGLPPDLDLSTPWSGRDEAFQRVMEQPLEAPSGSQFIYSDLDFVALGFLIERVAGTSLPQFAEEHIFRPLGMKHTAFNPPRSWLEDIAPTERDEKGIVLRGVVHDPTARRMGGVAGHAGLFSTADDLALYAQALLDGVPILSPEIIEKMTTPQQPANATVLRGLGWDIDSPFSTNRGELLPIGSFGHTGFTGTSLWIDPYTQTYIILLTNAVHPHGKNNGIVTLRTEVATMAAEALQLKLTGSENAKLAAITGYNESLAGMRRLGFRNGKVMTGIDVLAGENFRTLLALAARKEHTGPVRVGILTNQTGVDGQGRRTIDLIASVPGVQLVAIFSPEHGLATTDDVADNSVDSITHLPIDAVYGETDAQRRPSSQLLRDLDAVVIDLQDAGARFYTYETTMGYFLEAAAKTGAEVLVLDRPNPITGAFVQGPVLQESAESFVGYHQLPVRHGMTMGELALLFNNERGIHARLTVMQMQGWQRGDWYDATALTWVNPSPNLRSLEAATLYPGVAIVEGTNVSVGRGTDTPFEMLGAPWIKAREFADYLNRRNIAGVRFVPLSFKPKSSIYAGEICNGVNLIVTDRNVLDSPELGVELASALFNLYPGDYKIETILSLLGSKSDLEAIKSGEDPRRIAEEWREPLKAFQKVRTKYLLYPVQ